MDTPTIAKYYREKEPMERLKLLEQSIAAEEDPEGNKIRKELWKVDDETPQRYPNRMIAYLSDQLSDTGAVAVDVGQHMVWSYQSFHNRQGQKTLFSGGHGAMGYALPAANGA